MSPLYDYVTQTIRYDTRFDRVPSSAICFTGWYQYGSLPTINHYYSSVVTDFLGCILPSSAAIIAWLCLVVVMGCFLHVVVNKFVAKLRVK